MTWISGGAGVLQSWGHSSIRHPESDPLSEVNYTTEIARREAAI